MQRKIIQIDESLCNGCAACVTGCAEGALAIIDGKARLVKEQFCDGFGDCIGHCPTGALRIIERDADAFDIDATRSYLRETQGEDAARRMDEANARHAADHDTPPPAARPRDAAPGGGCPGSRMRASLQAPGKAAAATATAAGPARVMPSEIDQWPLQLHLVPPGAPFFKGRELVILSTCAPVAAPDVQWRFVRGRSLVIACPKLDRTEPYVDKLAAILAEPSIPKAIVVRMEVPCCGGLSRIAATAAAKSGRTDLVVEEATVTLDGRLQDIHPLHPTP